MAVIELTKVSKTYRRGFRAVKVPAVVDLSFSIEPHRVVGFVGPNGAGKTTTIKMIMGLARPSSGSVVLHGIDAASPAARKNVAFLSEQPCFYGHLTVFESLGFAAQLLGLSQKRIGSDIECVLATVGLTGKERFRVRDMSKGMQQRLNMAQALLGDVSTFILDEPMSGMDPPGRRLFRSLFRELTDRGKTIFFSTHVLEDIESVCDEVVVLSKGYLEYSGSVALLLDRGFLGTEIVVGDLPSPLGSTLRQCGYEITSQAGSTVIFVPRTADVSECQRMLFEAGIWCRSVTSRTTSLEKLLYGTTTDSQAVTSAPLQSGVSVSSSGADRQNQTGNDL